MAIEVNGVTLPDIPADVLAEYPYYTLLKSENFPTVILFATQSEQMILLAGVYSTDAIMTKNTGGYAMYGAEDGRASWELGEQVAEFGAMELGAMGLSIVWANHDVMKAVLDTASATFVASDEIYFPSSVVAEPKYGKIRRAIIRGASNAVRRKTGRTDKFPPEQLEYEIDSIVTADGLPNAEEYSFGGSATEYGMDADPTVFTSKVNSQLTVANAFRPVTDVEAVGLRFADLTTGSYWLYLWDISGKVLWQSAAWIKGNATKEWVEEKISPVTLTAGNQYVVGVYCNSYSYSANESAVQANSKIDYYKHSASSGKGTFSSDLSTGTSSKLYACDVIIGASANLPETYQISLDRLNRLANAVKTVTGNSNAMTVEEIISAVESVATATAEE